MEISNYLKATDETVKAAYTGWPVFARASQVRAAEESWSVEVGVAAVEMYADGYNNRAKLRCQALVRYVAKAPTHDSLPQALDIATSLGAFLNHATMAMEDPDAPDNRVAVGEIVRDVRVFTEAETVMRGGVRVPTGGVQVILQWEDELTVTPDIVIAGYDVTSPNRPPAQPGIDPPILQEITSVSLLMPPGDDFDSSMVAVDVGLPDLSTIKASFVTELTGADADYGYGGELLYIPRDGLGTLAKDQAVTIEGQKYRVTSLAADGRCWLASVEATS